MRVSAPRSRIRPLRPLIIGPEAKAVAERIIRYAEAHPFHPGVDPSPGDNPRFVAHLNTYRAVFTFTHASDGKVYRHLSVSIPTAGLYPHPAAILTIATLFGFTGWDQRTVEHMPDGWHFELNETENYVQVAQARE